MSRYKIRRRVRLPLPRHRRAQSQVTVVQPPAQTIVIQAAQPTVVYVPTYNPTVVYGAPVAAYPGYSTGDMVATSLISFGLGVAVGAAISGGGGCCGWGYNSWGCGWHNSSVTYNRNVYVSNSNTFANRNNYYNRNNANINNVNRNNFNRNNVNTNDINRNNLNRNNANLNNRANNFSTPNFSQKDNQPQFRNTNANNLAQQRGGGQSNLNQQNRPGANQNRPGAGQNQARAGNLNQNQRQPQRGYGNQAGRGNSNGAFSNYGQGGNARTNSARGQQSLQGGGNRAAAGGGANRAAAGGGGNRAAGGGPVQVEEGGTANDEAYSKIRGFKERRSPGFGNHFCLP